MVNIGSVLGVLVLVSAGEVPPVGSDMYNPSLTDERFAKNAWELAGAKFVDAPCGFAAASAERVKELVKLLRRDGKSTAKIESLVGKVDSVLGRCKNPNDLVPRVDALATEIATVDAWRISPYFGGAAPGKPYLFGYGKYLVELENLARSRRAVRAIREFMRHARSMLQPCLGDRVLDFVDAATKCHAPRVELAPSYARAVEQVQESKTCSDLELTGIKLSMTRLNALAKDSKGSCVNRKTRSRIVAKLCKNQAWLRNDAPALCAIANGKKP